MGLFGKIFEKKSCDICGGEIGLLGNRKLEDGNLCKECAKKLSPFFSERRRSTVEQIREQLDYREANKDRVAGFNTTRTLRGDTKVLLDEDAQCFNPSPPRRGGGDANPDVMDFLPSHRVRFGGSRDPHRNLSRELRRPPGKLRPAALRHRLRRVPHHPRELALLRRDHVQGQR